ncbi:hypothetical protein MYP_4546 [Sporocytophaga myxococcoides]|uniref:Uncharacterized protein n=1 Tax=Sporocytophaga myxococcoides TaxID=153721 RepID=A0A098LK15_9BACT|nr:hypothetical protein [Sporocytophaga myxococcoides]GAL87316.1 hypothetical protein MYP_4546 [Sporocytophaga myxococcoides]
MKNNNLDDLSDDELYASFEAYKALLDAGLSKDQALSRTGLTAQIVKDLEDEEKTMEEEDEYDFKDEWENADDDDADFDDDSNWKEENFDEEGSWDDDDAGAAGWEDRY